MPRKSVWREKADEMRAYAKEFREAGDLAAADRFEDAAIKADKIADDLAEKYGARLAKARAKQAAAALAKRLAYYDA